MTLYLSVLLLDLLLAKGPSAMIYRLLKATARSRSGMTLVLSSRRTEQELCQRP